MIPELVSGLGGTHDGHLVMAGSKRPPGDERLQLLDGWRALSITFVVAGHWLPLGPRSLDLNTAVAAAGMAIFFTLSGFLITRFLLDRPEPGPFLIRRLLRILPLAWLAMLILFLVAGSEGTWSKLLANLLFYVNLTRADLLPGGGPLWSLCVEMHFYLGVALLVASAGRRGLLCLPFLAVAVTAARVIAGQRISIVTWFRVDEILAGATLALVCAGLLGSGVAARLARTSFYLAVGFATLCTYFIDSPLAYVRPYAVALMVGVSLFHCPRWVGRMLYSRAAAYLAKISYAVYVMHGMLWASWLGTGETLVKYAKRPLLVAATWALAHLSTFAYEQRFIDLARRLTARREPHALTAL